MTEQDRHDDYDPEEIEEAERDEDDWAEIEMEQRATEYNRKWEEEH